MVVYQQGGRGLLRMRLQRKGGYIFGGCAIGGWVCGDMPCSAFGGSAHSVKSAEVVINGIIDFLPNQGPSIHPAGELSETCSGTHSEIDSEPGLTRDVVRSPSKIPTSCFMYG